MDQIESENVCCNPNLPTTLFHYYHHGYDVGSTIGSLHNFAPKCFSSLNETERNYPALATNFSIFDNPTNHYFYYYYYYYCYQTILSTIVFLAQLLFQLLYPILFLFAKLILYIITEHQLSSSITTILCLIILLLLAIALRRRLLIWRIEEICAESCAAAHRDWFRINNDCDDNDNCDLERVRRYGKVFGSFDFITPVLCVADHRVIRQILTTHSDNFAMQNTWQIEGHLLTESIVGNDSAAAAATKTAESHKRQKAILFSALLSRKIKLLLPTTAGHITELRQYLLDRCEDDVNARGGVEDNRDRRKRSYSYSSIHDLVFPWLVYSLLSLFFDIELPQFGQFRSCANSRKIVSRCAEYIAENKRVARSPLLGTLLGLAPAFARRFIARRSSLLAEPNRAAIDRILHDSIRFCARNRTNEISKRRVKFCDQIYDDEDKQSGQNKSNQEHSAPKRDSTFIDILLSGYEAEEANNDNNNNNNNSSNCSNSETGNYYYVAEGGKIVKTGNRCGNGADLRQNLLALFGISLRTLTITICGAIYELARSLSSSGCDRDGDDGDSLQCRLRREIRKNIVIGAHRCVSWEDIRTLTYMDAFVRECLRTYTPVARLERVCTRDCVIRFGAKLQRRIRVTRGMRCRILASAVHRDPDYWPRPDQFLPERFCDSDDADLDDKFLSFGLGARACIGRKFVMFYLKHLIANLLVDFEIRLAESTSSPCWSSSIKRSKKRNARLAIVEFIPIEQNAQNRFEGNKN